MSERRLVGHPHRWPRQPLSSIATWNNSTPPPNKHDKRIGSALTRPNNELHVWKAVLNLSVRNGVDLVVCAKQPSE